MKLKEKAEIDFLNWFLSKNYDHKKNPLKVGLGYSIMEAFHILPDNMKWGVYVDFFINKDMNIVIDSNHSGWFYEINKVNGTGIFNSELEYSAISVIRVKAIEKATEIYNG